MIFKRLFSVSESSRLDELIDVLNLIESKTQLVGGARASADGVAEIPSGEHSAASGAPSPSALAAGGISTAEVARAGASGDADSLFDFSAELRGDALAMDPPHGRRGGEPARG